VGRGDVIPAIGDVIFKLKPNEVSEMVETSMGYHLFRLEERKEGHKRSFEEARDEIFSKIFREKGSEQFRLWMEELKRKAYISVR
jgi:parvulin-like peptidyl-prolyl isomerase